MERTFNFMQHAYCLEERPYGTQKSEQPILHSDN